MFEQYIANDYLRAGTVLVFLLVILRIIVSIGERVILHFVKKTKTELDDIVIKKTSLPITFVLLFFSIEIALLELTLSSDTLNIVNKIMNTFVIILIGYIIYVILDVFLVEFWKRIVKRSNKKTIDSLTSLLHGIFKIIILTMVIVYILHYWGIQIAPLLAGLGIAGIAVALAIQPTLSNIFSGMAIILDDSVRVGDLIYIDSNTKGKIVSIGLRSTKINTFDNETLIIPNSKLADSTIQNVALPEPKSRVVVSFSVAYGVKIDKVKEIVIKELKTIKIVCKDPEPLVRFIEMGTSSLNFKAYYYVDNYEDRFASIDEANTKIYDILRKNNIDIPFSQIDVHLKKD